MSKEILPTPVLKPRPNFWQRLLFNLKMFGMIGAGGFVVFMIMALLIPPAMPLLLAIQMSAIVSGAVFLLGFLLGITNPSTETVEEAAYRKRLEAASHYYVHEDQMKADLQELLKTCDELGSEGLKGMKDREIIQLTIKRAFEI